MMSLLSKHQMNTFTNAFTRDMNLNIKNHITRQPKEKILFEEEEWTMTDDIDDELTSQNLNGARLWHQCDELRERYQAPFDTIRGTCWCCKAKVPGTIRTLWTLYNADNMHQWLDTDDIFNANVL